jgi:glycine oxidase
MPKGAQTADVVVVGGGIIGLAVAWRARQRGMSVTVLERDAIARGASHVAAGMLAPVAEVEFGESARRLLELGLRSAEMWPAFASELEALAGREVGLARTGTLLLARDDDEARELERQIAFRDSLGLRTERLRPTEAREREPALAPTLRLALEAPEDHSVDPRLVLQALRMACQSTGVQLLEHASVARIESDGDRGQVTGVTLGSRDAPDLGSEDALERSADVGGDGEGTERKERHREQFLAAAQVVLAAGAWVEQIDGLPRDARVPVRPVKGQVLRLRDHAGPGLLRRVVRFHGGYLVPRADGRYVLGATVEERGFELEPAVRGVYELLRDAHELVPGVSELQIEELSVGLRPGTPDNLPAIGPGALEGLTWAAGHYRSGILLAPLTAELVVGVLTGEKPVDPLLSACAPGRFTAPSRPSQLKDLALQGRALPSLQRQALS